MGKLCRRCGGAGWLLRNPKNQTEQQQKRAFGAHFGNWLTRCTDCGGDGVKGRKGHD